MKRFLREFLRRGLVACGFGPIVLAVIYILLEKNGVVQTIPIGEAVLSILTSALLAFIAGGINAVYQVERLPLIVAVFIHGITLYADYIVIYLVNNWISAQWNAIVVFTVCFFSGFAIIWAGIYLYMRRSAEKLNRKLREYQQKTNLP